MRLNITELLTQQAALGSILSLHNNISLDVAETYRRHCLEQWTEA